MSSNHKWGFGGGISLIANASQVIAANATTAFDFGTPNDVDLANSLYEPGDRLLLVLSATRAAGTTSTLAFTVQDAPDDGGSIGTPAAAETDGTTPAFATDSGAVNKSAVIGIRIKNGRPWIRVNAVHGTAGTDSFQCHAALYSVKSNV